MELGYKCASLISRLIEVAIQKIIKILLVTRLSYDLDFKISMRHDQILTVLKGFILQRNEDLLFSVSSTLCFGGHSREREISKERERMRKKKVEARWNVRVQ